MPSTDRSRMTPTSVVFITFDENAKVYKVHAPGNVEGVDMGHAYGNNRKIRWVFHNQTSNDVTVKMKFDPTLFGDAFDTTNPAAQKEGDLMTITQRVLRTTPATVEGVTKTPSIGGWDLYFKLDVENSEVDPGLRIDDGKNLTIVVAVVSFAAGLLIGTLLL